LPVNIRKTFHRFVMRLRGIVVGRKSHVAACKVPLEALSLKSVASICNRCAIESRACAAPAMNRDEYGEQDVRHTTSVGVNWLLKRPEVKIGSFDRTVSGDGPTRTDWRNSHEVAIASEIMRRRQLGANHCRAGSGPREHPW
jgi:hypothetical protein